MPQRLLAILLLVATAVLPSIAAARPLQPTETARASSPVGCCGADCRCDANCPCAAREDAPAESPAPPVAPTPRDDARLVAMVGTAASAVRVAESAPRAPPAPGARHTTDARRPSGRHFREISGSWHE